MKKTIVGCLGFVACASSTFAIAATGEYWEISSQMEMPGMPFAMPAQTTKVCLPKGGEGDPQRTQGKDRNCTFKDVQRSGNTVKFKGTCVSGRGDTMDMTGETTHDSNSFKTKMQMIGGKQGQPMTMSSSGKRVGGSCDTEEMAKKAEAQAEESKQQMAAIQAQQKGALAKMCANPGEADFNKAAYYAGSKPMCSNKKEYCQAVRDKAGRDAGTFEGLTRQEEMRKQYAAQGVKKTEEISVINICGLDMASLNKNVCKNSLHKGPQDFMDKYCSPEQAKEYREFARKQQDCAGRGYTSDSRKMKACMDGTLSPEDLKKEECRGRGYTSDNKMKACMAGKPIPEDEGAANAIKPDSVLDGAKKLKGLFGF